MFGLNDAPRLWWTRLRDYLKKNDCRQSRLDPSLFMYEPNGVLQGIISTHVDDLLGAGGDLFDKLLDKIDKEFGFGTREYDSFRHTGKNIRKDMTTGEITVDMKEYVENLTPCRITRERRAELEGPLTSQELSTLRQMNGALQWLQHQSRPDLSCGVSLSQSSTSGATVKDLIEAQKLIARAKDYKDFALKFRSHDITTGGFMAISDAGLGGVEDEALGGPVRSQGGYLIVFGDESLTTHGNRGRFTLLDWRSRKIKRVCRSSFAAETLALADANDAVQHLRGALHEIMDPLVKFDELETLSRWKVTLVVDARDCYDHLIKETSAQPQQRTLLFDLAGIREYLNETHTTIRWTATENMLADAMTKTMDTTHMMKILVQGVYSVAYDTSLVNPRTTKAKPPKKPKTVSEG